MTTNLWTKPTDLSHRPNCRQLGKHIHHCHIILLSPKADTHYTPSTSSADSTAEAAAAKKHVKYDGPRIYYAVVLVLPEELHFLPIHARSPQRHQPTKCIQHTINRKMTTSTCTYIHSNTADFGPAVSLCLVLVVRTTGFQHWLVNAPATSNNTCQHYHMARQSAL